MNVNELGRTGSIVMAAAVLAIVAASVRLYAQGSADTSTSIVGVWTLDKKLSDVGEERPHNGGGQRSRGGGGGGGLPGGGRGRGGFHGGGGARRAIKETFRIEAGKVWKVLDRKRVFSAPSRGLPTSAPN